jgi:hypothetical protein
VGFLVVCPKISAAVVKNRTRAITNQCFHLITGLLVCAQLMGKSTVATDVPGKKAGKVSDF